MTQTNPLSLADISECYPRDGFAFPYRVLPAEEAIGFRDQFEQLLATDPKAKAHLRGLAHLVYPLVDQIAHDERVIDAAQAVLGPDILLYGAAFFPKPPRTKDFVSWHQDLTYWGFDGVDEVTVWLALSPVTVANGCMRFLPESHRDGIQPHADTFAENNSLTRGQELAVEIDEAQAVHITLDPGEVSLHHGRLFHASGANSTDRWRLGLAMQFLAPSMKQVVASRDYAQLVRGEDRFGHFKTPPRPKFNYDPQCLAVREDLMAAQSEALYVGVDRKPGKGELYIS